MKIVWVAPPLGRRGRNCPARDDWNDEYHTDTRGNYTSEKGEESGEIDVVPAGALELAAQGSLGGVLLHDVDRHMSQDGEVLGAMTRSVPGLVFVHDHIQPPVQAILDAPVRADDFVEAFAGHI